MTEYPIAGHDEVPVTESCKINGPPGTGKTTQGLARVQSLVEDHEYAVNDVTWITYRRSLGEEIVENMADWGMISDESASNPTKGETEYLSTAHAVCYRLQRDQFRDKATPSWDDYRDFMRDTYKVPYSTSPSSSSESRGELLFDVYYWLVNNRKTMLEARDCPMYHDLLQVWPSAPDLGEFAAAWEDYKRENDLVDYYEYLERAVESDVSPGTEILVVDEYHDAYPLLDKLARQWIDAADTAIVLGDPQQVVNVHEGASPQYFEDIDLPEIQLDTTYRVPESLWAAAANVLKGSHDPHYPDFAAEDHDNAIDVVISPEFRYSDITNEWDAPSQRPGSPDALLDRYVDEGESAMYLTRAKFQQAGIAAALQDAGSIFRAQMSSVGCWRSYDRRRHLFNALKRIEDLGDDGAYLREEEAEQLIRYAGVEHLEFERDVIIEWGVWAYDDANEDVDLTHTDTLDDFVEDSFWTAYTQGPRSVQRLVEREGDSALPREVLQAALRRNDNPTVGVRDDGDGLDTAPVIRTIHASKGTEADRVFLYDGITSKIRRESRSDLSIERNEDRVWYVGLTRASKQTVVVRGAFPFLTDYVSKGVFMA